MVAPCCFSQISVNIGGDPSGISGDSMTVNVQSPGMVSLNSLGTGSPVGTPAPTPTPPTVVPAPQPQNSAAAKSAETTSVNRLDVIYDLFI